MARYLSFRFLYMLVVLAMVSVVAFVIICLPPGDFATSYVASLADSQAEASQAMVANLRAQYGLDQPLYVQYWLWISGVVHGDFGQSFDWRGPVRNLIGERLALTIIISLSTLFITYVVAIPIGIYSAVRQYSILDYVFTTVGFVGLATPNFLLALLLMIFFLNQFGFSPGGLFAPAYVGAPWSAAKVIDLLKHLPVPLIVIGMHGTAGLIRVMRGTLLDELRKQYVITARAKGVSETKLLFKYPVRMALNPLVSTVGWLLPSIVSGSAIVEVVLGLPTTGPLLLRALLAQDMYLAASMIMILSFLTVIGTFLSDMLLVWLDPRIRFEKGV
jgi:peptide/nickel transport system permease protein